MPTVAITDYTFPELEIEQSILSSGGFELRSGNDRRIPALQALVADADAVITQFAATALRGEPLPNVVNGVRK